MPVRRRKRKCNHCHTFFSPDCRNIRRQRYCSAPECGKASKRASQARWLGKPENRDYFKGPENVARVKAWRKQHPGYWRRPTSLSRIALQEDCSAQPAEINKETSELNENALQDLCSLQPTVIIGLISHLTGIALQEDIAKSVRQWHKLGFDIVNGSRARKGACRDEKKPYLPATFAKGPEELQLGGSPSGP